MGPLGQAPSKTLTPQGLLNPWAQQAAHCFVLEKGSPPHLEIIQRPLQRETGEMSSVLPETCPHLPSLLLNRPIGPSISMACVEKNTILLMGEVSSSPKERRNLANLDGQDASSVAGRTEAG